MKVLFFLTIFLGASTLAGAQEQQIQHEARTTGNQFYAELMGPGVVFSANFDFRFSPAQEGLGWGLRMGVGYGLYSFDEYAGMNGISGESYQVHSFATIPLGINYVFGKKNSPHAFEVGAGATVLTRSVAIYYYGDKETFGNIIGHTSFMYRRKPVNGGFTWRIGFTPIIGTAGDLYPSGSFGLGYAF